jgi:lipopolysaccharide/colanic/teichoic acid biosynthesis glycosyltransferase
MKRFVLLCLDLALVVAATLAALMLRDNFEIIPSHLEALLPYLAATVVFAAILLPMFGANNAMWRFTTTGDYVKLMLACALIVFASLALAFAHNRLEGISRSLPVLQFILSTVFLISVRLAVRARSRRRLKPKQLEEFPAAKPLTSVLVVGVSTLTELYLRAIAEFASDQVRVVGIVARRESKIGRSILGYKVNGRSDALMERINALHVHGVRVDYVAVMTSRAKLSQAERQAMAEVEANTDIVVQYLDELTLGEMPLARHVAKRATPQTDSEVAFVISNEYLDKIASRPYWQFKRLMDVVFAAFLIVATAPVAALVAFLVAIDVGFPVIFWQQRPGVGGYPFRVYKFRTMRVAHASDGHRASDDERSSKIGKFLRRTRLDELPQLWNILAGQMSFVGPRPLLPKDQPPAYAARKFVRPGLTGWAQVNGGRAVPAADKAALDMWYIGHASLALDLKIIAYTVGMVLLGERVNATVIRRAWADLDLLGISRRAADGASSIRGLVVSRSAKGRTPKHAA